MLERREFLRLASAGAAAFALPAGLAGASRAAPDPWSESFARALSDDPRWLPWQGVSQDRIDGPVRVEGRLPAGLRGIHYRIGPAVHERFGLRYRHWFDGDGMLQEYRFDGRSVSHRARVLQTPKLRREREAGRRLYTGFGTQVPEGRPVRRPDEVNSANTALLDHHGALYALWEGGSASRIDRESLDWSGFRDWGGNLRGVPFAAHPKTDPDGTLWAFGCLPGPHPRILLYRISSDGALADAAAIDVAPLGMVHDFAITERSLVLVVPPYVFDPDRAGGTLLDAHVWRPELGSRALVVSKGDLSERRWHSLPAGFGFHHGNGWEESDGTIRFDHCLAEDPSLVRDRFRGFMRGRLEPGADPHYARIVLRPGRDGAVDDRDGVAEFPSVAPAFAGRRNRFVYTLGAGRARPGFALHRIEKRDLESGGVEFHDYGTGVVAEEHLFVARPGGTGEDDGWLVGAILDTARRATAVSVLDARRPGDGPLALAWLDRPLPLTFHGSFRSG